jgi:predicted nucleic acid-binding protein
MESRELEAGLVVLDTSALFAALDRGQQHHRAVLDALRPHVGSLIVPVAILAEISHFIERDLGQTAVSALARDIERGAYELDCGLDDWQRIRTLIDRYHDLPLGIADAAVIACAERRKAAVATLDFRHFGAVARESTISILSLDS